MSLPEREFFHDSFPAVDRVRVNAAPRLL